MWGELAYSLQQGDGYMMAMIVFAFIATMIIVERYVMISFVYNLNFKKFLLNLKRMLASDDYDRAINLCKSISKTSLPHITLKALEAAERDPSKIRGTIEEESIEFLPKVESRISVLPALATVILLIGILGTIDGIWDAFHSINVLDTSKKQASLANGIAGSLNPTAFALMASMLILMFHQLLANSAVKLTEKIQHGLTVLYNVLAPPEMATYALAGVAPAASPAPASAASDDLTETPETQEEVSDYDAFDDASVEDIKDEEEII